MKTKLVYNGELSMGYKLTSTDLRKAVRKLRERNMGGDPNYQVVVHPDAEYDLKEQINELLATADAMDNIKLDQEMRTAVERWKKRLGA